VSRQSSGYGRYRPQTSQRRSAGCVSS
jgi:hypothetical protein